MKVWYQAIEQVREYIAGKREYRHSAMRLFGNIDDAIRPDVLRMKYHRVFGHRAEKVRCGPFRFLGADDTYYNIPCNFPTPAETVSD